MRRIATCHCGARRFRRRPTTTGDGGRRSSGDSCRWSRAWDVPPHGCSIEDSMRSSFCECFSLLGWSGSCGSCKRGRSSWVTAKSLARGSSPATFESRTRPRCRTSTRGRTECGCIRCPSGTRRCVCSTLKGASGSSSSPVFAMKTWCCSRTLALTTGTTQNGSCLPTCAAGDAKRARGFGSNRRTSRTSAYATTIRSGVSRCSRCSRTESKPCGFCAIPRSPASSSRASRSSSRTCPFFITVCGRASRTRCSRGPDVAGRPHAPFSQSVLDLAGVAGDRVGLITTSPRFSTGWGLLSPAHASRHTPNSLSGGGVHAAARKGNSSLSGGAFAQFLTGRGSTMRDRLITNIVSGFVFVLSIVLWASCSDSDTVGPGGNPDGGPTDTGFCRATCTKDCLFDQDCEVSAGELCCDLGTAGHTCLKASLCPRFCSDDSNCEVSMGQACVRSTLSTPQKVCTQPASGLLLCSTDND